ncbi:ABC transporter substrate-binding protein [Roseobacter sp. HKCCD9010]|uniref:ABC transporter substrate-binding protein n=1 Tax=unclassified Roseobacter TaxID=196798 RepID=UPI001491DC4F|nr:MULTISPECIES: ABC transporter substrate-binding protein [unclassified Roseobacter]MBF9052521.1 ABC transporter substrate-binding protein [Rhodobacterales bacterium HKCCD4356]NNW51673.1 ABC transporter substrate-binding protein [Roseobacter sp. HKCCD9144]NNW60239.1 ABC transporter substrate-binding protein [Roseobacter sp. HKCCD8629]NNX79447.1 ABC transporter substrate-binding protein [Roseobacter sp. HKCCD8481]NNX87974.1 ABC transporter substrate-binding protein [Roseobacter sp. HKCCD8809]
MQTRSALALGLVLTLAVPAFADQISFTDQFGRDVTLPGPSERLATIPIPAASMAVAVNGSPEPLVGMHRLSQTAIVEGILGEFFPETRDIPSDIVGDGFMPNVEAMLTLDPDLVLQWGTRGPDIVQPLEAAGLTVATLRYGREEDAAEWIGMMGMVLGQEERSTAILDWRADALEAMQARAAGIADTDRPRTLYFLRYLSSYRVAGEGTYNDFWMELGGGDNVAHEEFQGFNDVNAEQVIAWDPEVIFLNGFEEALSPEDVYSNPLFADLSAVQNRRVYKLPIGGYRWDPPNQESPLTWAWVGSLLHPDLPVEGLRDQISARYEMLYGQTPDADDIDDILRVGMNGDSAHYAQFLR